MMSLHLLVGGLFMLACCDAAADSISGYHDQGSPSADTRLRFLSKSQVFSVERGEDITFPCDVKDIGDNKMTFKYVPTAGKGPERLFFAGDDVILKIQRLRKQGQHYLLSRVRRTDAGQYVCRVESEVPLELRHTLNVLYPARIIRVSSESYHVVKGESVSLECFAEGNPRPVITWSRKGGLLPNGAMSLEGDSLDFAHVDRHVEGTYYCTASNGIKSPHTSEMTVVVEYLPEITTQTVVVHSGEGQLAQLVCIVFGRPRPAVSWLRGDNLVDSNNHVIDDDGATRHALTITRVAETDFGNYTCSARNKHGRVEKSIVLTGRPTTPEIISNEFGLEKNTYSMTWRTQSFSKIVQYRIRYRKEEVTRMHSLVADSSWLDSLYSPDSQKAKPYSQVPTFYNSNPDEHYLANPGGYYPSRASRYPSELLRTHVNLTASMKYPFAEYSYEGQPQLQASTQFVSGRGPADHESTQQGSSSSKLVGQDTGINQDPPVAQTTRSMTHIINNLETDASYQVTVSVENKYGWSDLSDIFTFYTKPEETTTTTSTTSTEEYHPRPQVGEVAVGVLANHSSRAAGPLASVSVVVIIQLLLLLARIRGSGRLLPH